MATSFTPRFIDLVRCTSSTTGTGNLQLGPAVAGFTSFAANLAVGDRFYYSVAGIDKPAEAEVGRGTLMANGSIAREAIAGSLTNFTIGQKTVSLVAGAEWFRTASAGAVDMTTVATRDKSDLGAAINELAGLSPLFVEIATTRIPATVRRIVTAGRAAVGVAPAAYVRDPDQSALTSIGQQWVDALPAGEQAAATSAVKAILDRVRTKDADNIYWVIDDDGQQVHAGHFGAIADGWFSYAGAIAGTDNVAAIQALIDWRTYLKLYTASANKECLLPPGTFRISKGLQLGYGDTFRTVVVRGAGLSFGGSLGGTTLVCDFTDHPALVIQGGRRSRAADLSLVSPKGLAYIYSKQLAGYGNEALVNFGIDDRDITSWFDPAFPTTSPLLRYNPYAGIAIDPYRGTQPAAASAWAPNSAIARGSYRSANSKLYIAKAGGTAAASGTGPSATTDNITDGTIVWSYVGPSSLSTSYPNVTIPAFLPAAQRATYSTSKAFSSNLPLSNVGIYGFAAGVVIQPCDDDGNGDFLELADCEIGYCAIQLSVGNTQARNNTARRLTGTYIHTAIVTNKHGRQNGKLGGVFKNCSWSALIQMLDLGGTSIVGPHSFEQCYMEDVWRIGEISGGGASGTAIIFNGCQWAFNHQIANGQRGAPLSLIGSRVNGGFGAGVGNQSYVFNDCIFYGFNNVAPLLAGGVRIENCTFEAVDFSVFTTQWRARALNTLAGGLVVPFLNNYASYARVDHLVHYTAANETTLDAASAVTTSRVNRFASRDVPASIYTPSLCANQAPGNEEIVNPSLVALLDKSQISAVSLVGRTLTFTLTGGNAQYAMDVQLWPGSVMVDASTGMVFFVQSMTGGFVFTAELQNGYHYSPAGTIGYDLPFNPSASGYYGPYFFVAGGGIFTPLYPLFADLSASSATLANCQRADGYSGFINATSGSAVKAGDRPYFDPQVDATFSGHVVNSVGAGTILLNGNPNVTAAQKRLPLWVRGS